jgi:hypothetical protein
MQDRGAFQISHRAIAQLGIQPTRELTRPAATGLSRHISRKFRTTIYRMEESALVP